MEKFRNYLFEIVTEDSELEGYQFLVQETSQENAWKIARENFPDERLGYYGKMTDFEAEMWGLDTF